MCFVKQIAKDLIVVEASGNVGQFIRSQNSLRLAQDKVPQPKPRKD